MKKLVALFLSLTLITSSVLASTKTDNLKTVIDEFNYTMEVEWDQKDVHFYSQQLDIFLAKISALNLDPSQNKQWLLEALSHLPESNYKSDVVAALEHIKPESLTLEKTQQMLREIASKSKSEGVNWHGGTATSIVVTAVILIVVLAILTNHHSNDRDEDGYQTIPDYEVEPVEPDRDLDIMYPDFGCDVYPMCDKYRT